VSFKKLKCYFVSTGMLPVKQLLNTIKVIYTGNTVEMSIIFQYGKIY